MMSDTMTPDDLAAILARHPQTSSGLRVHQCRLSWCAACGQGWPCDAVRLAEAFQQAEDESARLQRENLQLRAALTPRRAS